MKVSIVVPIYNAEEFLERCIKSVIDQDYTDFECLLIDDGSTDKSAEICKDYVRKDSRFVYIKQENGGVSKARNTGIEFAKGEWISFVDSDDMLAPFFLSEAVGYISTGADEIIGGGRG